MATRNDITGDQLVSKATTEAYRSGWDVIDWNKKDTPVTQAENTVESEAEKLPDSE